MKHGLSTSLLLVGVCLSLDGARPAAAQEWSPIQKDIVSSIESYAAALLRANVDEMMAYFHPRWRGWDFSEGVPMDKRGLGRFFAYILSKHKPVSFEIQPVSIEVDGTVAAVHAYYKEILRDAGGADVSSGGRWSLTLLKQGDRWLFLSESWLNK